MAYTTIDNPELHFQVQLYTGNGAANNAITLGGDEDMQPDLVWIKNRDQGDSHCVFDSLRGATKVLHPDATSNEATDTDTLDSFATDGFQVDADVKVNTNTEKYVAWCWKANGTGSSNTDGSIDTTATSANTTSGFSIMTWVGTGSAATIGHGLGAEPTWFVVRNRGVPVGGDAWANYSKAGLGNTYRANWDRTTAPNSGTNYWNNTTPTSTLITVGADGSTNADGLPMLTYAWAPIQGFSKFGSYEGNGNADGTFVWTGFRPAFVMTESIDSTSSWHMFDNKREGFNAADGATFGNNALVAEATSAETATNLIDILSNGFKCRVSTDPNVAETYIYMAFAEAPFVNSNGVPCNAR